jgi:hypothetical protein
MFKQETAMGGRNPLAKGFIQFANWTVRYGSGEYLLDRPDVSNGGTIVFARALHVSVAIICSGLLLRNWLDPARDSAFSVHELRIQLMAAGPWFGTVFAAGYAALYARFASQWTYLAGVYNQIKAAEARKDSSEDVLADWKAGFIEDASELHLIRKRMFASIVRTWAVAHDGKVRAAFELYAPGGKPRFEALMQQVNEVVDRMEATFESPSGAA